MLHRLTQLSQAFSAVLLSIGAYGLFVACSDAFDSAIGCFDDDDCGGDAVVCLSGFCERTCSTDQDCRSFERCGSRIEDGVTINICQPSSRNNTTPSCQTSAECVMRLNNPDAQCAVDGVCFVPEPSYAILIRDRTTVDVTNPKDQGLGADIAAVYIESDAGNIVAQGDTLVIEPANDVDVPTGVIDGNPPVLNDDLDCIAGGFDGNVVALGGEGGHMLVRFLDTDFRAYEAPPDTWNIVVLEWGDTCEGGVSDSYEVFFCETTTLNDIDLDADCESLGTEDGRGVFTVGTR